MSFIILQIWVKFCYQSFSGVLSILYVYLLQTYIDEILRQISKRVRQGRTAVWPINDILSVFHLDIQVYVN